MRLLHTADWHLGHQLHGMDREVEHSTFLAWFLNKINELQPNVVLLSGDIFDQVNPSIAAIFQFHAFLGQLQQQGNDLNFIAIAGNHDSASRLASSQPLLESPRFHLIGPIPRKQGTMDYQKLVIPLYQGEQIIGRCLAAPFLRLADIALSEYEGDYPQGVAAFYQNLYTTARSQGNEPLIAMGHGFFQGGESSPLSERTLFIGGADALSTEMFPSDIAYVALGHLHRPQAVQKPTIRYAGSPIPLSFSEIDYPHQILQIDLLLDGKSTLTPHLIPRRRQLLRIPNSPKPLDEVLKELSHLPNFHHEALPPLLAVQVILTGPEGDLKPQIERIIQSKNLVLADILRRYPELPTDRGNFSKTLNELTPVDVFTALLQQKFNTVPDTELLITFQNLLLATNGGS